MARGDKTEATTCDLPRRSIAFWGDGSFVVTIPSSNGASAVLYGNLADVWGPTDRATLIALLKKAEDATLTAAGRALS